MNRVTLLLISLLFCSAVSVVVTPDGYVPYDDIRSLELDKNVQATRAYLPQTLQVVLIGHVSSNEVLRSNVLCKRTDVKGTVTKGTESWNCTARLLHGWIVTGSEVECEGKIGDESRNLILFNSCSVKLRIETQQIFEIAHMRETMAILILFLIMIFALLI